MRTFDSSLGGLGGCPPSRRATTCGLVLAVLCAEVIKVEPLDGDHTRKLVASGVGFFPTCTRNKRL